MEDCVISFLVMNKLNHKDGVAKLFQFEVGKQDVPRL